MATLGASAALAGVRRNGKSGPDIALEPVVIVAKNAVGDDDLLDEARGGVTVTSPATPGSKVTVAYPSGEIGEQVNVYLFSDPVALGTFTLGAGNSVAVTIPEDTELADTGANGIAPLATASALLLLLGAGVLTARRYSPGYRTPN